MGGNSFGHAAPYMIAYIITEAFEFYIVKLVLRPRRDDHFGTMLSSLDSAGGAYAGRRSGNPDDFIFKGI